MGFISNDNNGFYMPVAPAGGGYGNGGFFGGDWAWILLLLLIGGNGWGMGGFGGGMWPMMMAGMGGFGGLDYLYPWLNNSQHMSDGFRDQAITTGITSIRDGIGDLSTQLCNGFAGVNAGVSNGFAQAEISANARQMASMEQDFAMQSALANCCCENRLGIANLGADIAREACADRSAAAQNTRDILENQNRGTQAILDKLCALELDGVKGQLAAAQRENVGLQNQLNMAALRESQTAQNAFIAQGLNNEVDALYNRLKSCPVGTYPVCNPNIYPGQNFGCGCGAA